MDHRLEKLQLVSDAASLAARALSRIDKAARWTKNAWALDARGRVVPIESPEAVRFCLVGAVLRAEHELHDVEVRYDGARSGAVKIVLDLLSLRVREELEDLGIAFEVVFDLSEASLAENRQLIDSHDLPVAFNGTKGIGYGDVFRVLFETAATLISLAESPDVVDLLIPGDPSAGLDFRGIARGLEDGKEGLS